MTIFQPRRENVSASSISKEDLLKWLYPIGNLTLESTTNEDSRGALRYAGNLYPFEIIHSENGDGMTFTIHNVGSDIILVSLLKRACYKTAYCVHCEVCEVECPTGALSVVPLVKIDKNKCIHCHKCLTFKDRGCVMANSINISETKVKTKMATSGIDRYSTFGLYLHVQTGSERLKY